MPRIKEVFAAAAQLVRMRLAERVEVAIEGGDRVQVEIGRADSMVFTIGKDGLVYGPNTTASAGNINDDSIPRRDRQLPDTGICEAAGCA